MESVMTQNLRIGMFGSGRIGIVHAGSIADTKGAELTWICDPMLDSAEKLAAQYGAKATANPDDIFNASDVDAILIASPTPTHVVDSLRAKANGAKVKIALGFNRRFHPQFETMNKRVKAGEIGNLEQLVILSRDPAPAPQARCPRGRKSRPCLPAAQPEFDPNSGPKSAPDFAGLVRCR